MKSAVNKQLFFFLPMILIFLVFLPTKFRINLFSSRTLSLIHYSIPGIIGLIFLTFGILKIYGYNKGIIGGGGKHFSDRCMGSCPTWSKGTNRFLKYALLSTGFVLLAVSIFGWFHHV